MNTSKPSFFIRIVGEAAPFAAECAGFDATGQPTGAPQGILPLSTLLETVDRTALEQSDIIILLPADKFFVTRVTLPEKQLSALIKAPAYMIEDQLAGPVEFMQVVAGQMRPAGNADMSQSAVAAVDQEWLVPIYDALQAAKIRATCVTSEACLMEAASGQIMLVPDGGSVLLASDTLATRFEADALQPFLELLADQQQGRTISLDVYAPTHHPLMTALSAFAGIERYELRHHPLSVSPLVWLAGQWLNQPSHAHIPNFTQTPASMLPSGQVASAIKQCVRIAAVWLVCMLVLQLATGFYLNREADQFYVQSEQRYRQLFPGASASPEQLQAFITAQGGANATRVMAFLGTLSNVLSPAPQMTQLRYHGADKTLSLSVQAADFGAFEQYRQSLTQAGIQASVDALTRADSGVKGNLHVILP